MPKQDQNCDQIDRRPTVPQFDSIRGPQLSALRALLPRTYADDVPRTVPIVRTDCDAIEQSDREDARQPVGDEADLFGPLQLSESHPYFATFGENLLFLQCYVEGLHHGPQQYGAPINLPSVRVHARIVQCVHHSVVWR